MKDFKKGGFGGGNRGGKSFGGNRGGGRSSFGGGNRGGSSFGGGDREMFQTTCSECGKRCEVPFRPTGEKPVYCNDCFGSKREGTFEKNDRPERSFKRDNDFAPSRDSAPKGNDDLKRQVEMINTKLDALIKMIQSAPRPTATMPKEESLKTMVEKTQKPAAKTAPAKKVAAKKAPAKTPAKKAVKVTKKAAPKKK
jgi:CxxC-x17-CxxC domain-containing protein